jgi:hypothetical protein
MYSTDMPKRSSKPPDVNQLAKFIGDKVTKQSSDDAPLFKAESAPVKESGCRRARQTRRLEGRQGQIRKLSPEKRSQIARKAQRQDGLNTRKAVSYGDFT